MNITVLCGGPSSEREVSLVSGKAVIDALRGVGHNVFASDVSPDDLSGLEHPSDVIFPVLHGQFGESGELQEIMEERGLTFVGSGSHASRLGMDKVLTKVAWKKAGLPTPKWFLADRPSCASKLFAPCVVKAIRSGSSIDVYLCATLDDASSALSTVLAKHGSALVEQFISGVELTIGILDQQPLAPIRITTTGGFYDFDAKYKGNTTEYRFDLGLPPELVERIRTMAQQAHEVVGCRDLSRVDLMLDSETQQPYFLEINTLPGFTPKSLLPKAAKHAGIEFGELVDRLVKRAYARKRVAA